PLAADLDIALRGFSRGVASPTRTPLFVRAAQLRYGPTTDPSLVVGRLRYAASALGMLDGGRVAAHVGALELAAFGGLVPDPLGGRPDTGASRFGGELIYDDATSPWQPRLAITAYGSTWSGKLDERRLTAVASTGHDSTWLSAWAEMQQFAADNPWNAPALDLTGAGATVEWRKHGNHVG